MHEFVILFHEMPADSGRASHWDFMLCDGQKLLTWSLDHLPAPGPTIHAAQLPDHDLKYLTFEGPINGNRGSVTQIAKGRFQWVIRDEAGDWRIQLFFNKTAWEVTAIQVESQFFDFTFKLLEQNNR